MDGPKDGVTEDVPRFVIVDGLGGQWLAVEVGQHNCAGGTMESSGAHEPHCGLEPIAPVVEVMDRAYTNVSEHRDLVSRLGFGDGVTEPMATNDTIVQWYADRTAEASEWQDSHLWNNDCIQAGRPLDEDCTQHDPQLRTSEAARNLLDALRSNWSALPVPWSQTILSEVMCALDDAIGNPPARDYPPTKDSTTQQKEVTP